MRRLYTASFCPFRGLYHSRREERKSSAEKMREGRESERKEKKGPNFYVALVIFFTPSDLVSSIFA